MVKNKRKAKKRIVCLILFIAGYIVQNLGTYYSALSDLTYGVVRDEHYEYLKLSMDYQKISYLIGFFLLICLGKRLHDINRSAWWLLPLVIFNGACGMLGTAITNAENTTGAFILLGGFISDIPNFVILSLCLFPAILEGNRFIDNTPSSVEKKELGGLFEYNSQNLIKRIAVCVAVAVVSSFCVNYVIMHQLMNFVAGTHSKVHQKTYQEHPQPNRQQYYGISN